ncbi:MAG: hypothetical protein JOY82_07720 [Streptosporangiaceae bacterium]|nr:hypothetical protein [Streptosporangiaceae bacterium]MBV9854401.1 hypothetical protein [Streptosporangiaceae bacterium]
MPGEAELPPGTVRDFVGLLFFFYRQAHRPTLREISDWIEKSGLPGTASTETIRKMLRGMTVPAHWETVRAVLEALSGLAGTGADSRLIYEDADGTRSSHLERLWHRALDEPDALYRQAEHDPWADDGTGGYSDEPPFLPETAP